MDIPVLIKEAKHGSRSAQKCLFDLFSGKLLIVCKRYVRNAEDAEECLLDGFYYFFKTMSTFNYHSDGALYAWLKRIIINQCLMLLRKKNIFTIVTEAAAEEIELPEDVFQKMSAEDIFREIIQLPVGYRTVFNLYIMEDMKHLEIAEILGITEGTSKSQLSKAKKLLQKNLISKGIVYDNRKSR